MLVSTHTSFVWLKCCCRALSCALSFLPQRCELCPHKDGALKRTDSGGSSGPTVCPALKRAFKVAEALSFCLDWNTNVYVSLTGDLNVPLIHLPLCLSGWAHVVCALYIPEVQFANVLTMEPIILQYVPHERYIKVETHTG